MTEKTGNNVVPLFPGKPSAIDLFQYDADLDSVIPSNVIDNTPICWEEHIEEARISQIAVTLSNMLTNAIEQCGYEHPNEDITTQKDFCLVIEAIISLVKRYSESHHALQDLADMCIIIDEDDEDGYDYMFVPPIITKKDGQKK